ncbi:ABC-F family ATP-binding cassette domain-containing protein [Elusimicrobiota bacterium]
MISLEKISKSYGKQTLFSEISFNVNRREKIGLLGRNGSGKTTLFNMITGRLPVDSGVLTIPNEYKLGIMEQETVFKENSVLDEIYCESSENTFPHWKIRRILFGLGFTESDMFKRPEELSGGFQMRLRLAKVFASSPDILLLDEPNNYLDVVAIRWLVKYLKKWRSELILISHDRYFMENIVTHSMVIHRKKIRKIKGEPGKLFNAIEKDEIVYEKTRLNEEKKYEQTELFIRRFRAKARLGGMVQSRIKDLSKLEKKVKLEIIPEIRIAFDSMEFRPSVMMEVEGLGFTYNNNEKMLIKDLYINIGKCDRIAVIGKNGKGKSTLLKLLAGELKPIEGTVKSNVNLKINYYAQEDITKLDNEKTVLEEIISSDPDCSNQRARDICGTLMLGGDLSMKKIKVLSGGEKSRILLGKAMVRRCNLLLLDEPTNHLDMESCEALFTALRDFSGCVVIVTHNEGYLEQFSDRLILFDEKIRVLEYGYNEFLKNIGWSSENSSDQITDDDRDLPDKKRIKRKQARLRQEKAKALKTLDFAKNNTEKTIENLENDLEQNTIKLIEASEKGDASLIEAFTRVDRELRPIIENHYINLEKLHSEYDSIYSEFEIKLKQIDNE